MQLPDLVQSSLEEITVRKSTHSFLTQVEVILAEFT